jgi:hypothetical protein
MKEYKVRFYQDNLYEVIEIIHKDLFNGLGKLVSTDYDEKSVFQGNLADCEAWIKLTEGGYM